MNRFRKLRDLLFAILLPLSCPALHAGSYLFFDEDDPLGADFYDAGIGQAQAPSALLLRATSGDKLPITTNTFRGECAALLQWTSKPGGSWHISIYNLGFAIKDISNFTTLQLRINGPKAIAGAHLPRLALRDAEGYRATPLPIASFLKGEMDDDPREWQNVSIPLTNFFAPSFTPASFLSLEFSQGNPDGNPHELWVDQVEFKMDSKQISTQKIRLEWTRLRTGDRAIQLHWRAEGTEDGQGYHVYRRSNVSGEFRRITDRPLFKTHFADLRVQNNHRYQYKIEAVGGEGEFSEATPGLRPSAFAGDDDFLEFIQATAFDYFWFEAGSKTGLVRDRSESWSPSSIAAVGFGLTAIGIGIDHGWITREQGRERTLQILSHLYSTRQGADARGTSGLNGWYYHFLDAETGLRFGNSELSSIDSALLFCGVLYSGAYFDQPHSQEKQIRELSQSIMKRVDWRWMLNGEKTFSMGWTPESGFIPARWRGYNEGSILYLLALGASELERKNWDAWTSTYEWKKSHGFEFIHFPPLFGHQYTACWIDFRNIADEWTAKRGITYFENSRRATLAQRAYAIANPKNHTGYGPNHWGFTACDGPGSEGYFGYIARGAPPPENDDGTIAPTAAGGSIPFAPQESIACLKDLYQKHRLNLWGPYGFQDAFNLEANWWAKDVIGVDQGPILIMIENFRTGSVWKRMAKNKILEKGLKKAGFRPVEKRTGTENSD